MKLRHAARSAFFYTIILLALAACQSAPSPDVIDPNAPRVPGPDETWDPRIHGWLDGQACIEMVSYVEEGEASWYGRARRPRKTASGEVQDINALTAAHRTLPLGSRIQVTNLKNGKSTILRINDRGPYKRGRILDVSQKSARELGFMADGTVRIRLETLEPRRSNC